MASCLAQGDMTNTRDKRLFLTGASGLLGRAIMRVFQQLDWIVYGTALSRVTPELHRINLLDKSEVETAIKIFNPTFVIHCAAQRFPEKVNADYAAAEKLNVAATEIIVKLCHDMGVPMIYISTDYVFDGKSPPYKVTDTPQPLNMYGRTKLMGEVATLKLSQEQQDTGNLVLRIPVLYGPVETLEESAVTTLLTLLLDRSKPHQVSDYEVRRPSHVDDIAKLCHLLVLERFKSSDVHGVFHWCGEESFTKYGMIQQMGEAFNLPFDHIIPSKEQTASSSAARPFDPTLDTSRTLAVVGPFSPPAFKAHVYETLLPWVERHIEQNPNQTDE